MVEKAGHKRALANQRAAWIDEGKPRSSVMVDDDDLPRDDTAPTATAPPATEARPTTPVAATATAGGDDVPDDDDIYDATPIRSKPTSVPIRTAHVPDDDEDDLDALMAEAEADSRRATTQNGKTIQSNGPPDEDEDDLDALMAEADAELQRNSSGAKDKPADKGKVPAEDDFADDEAAMAEMGGLW